MSSMYARQFDSELLRLFTIRTHYLRASLWPTVGKAPHLTQKQIRRSIARLQNIAEADFFRSRYGKRLLKDYDDKRQWHPKRGKGLGWRAKRLSFKTWYQKKKVSEKLRVRILESVAMPLRRPYHERERSAEFTF